jgi:hypothetical protein
LNRECYRHSASTAIRHVPPDVAAACAALRADGMAAPKVIDGAMDGSGLLAYVEWVVVPTGGRIVVMGSLCTP